MRMELTLARMMRMMRMTRTRLTRTLPFDLFETLGWMGQPVCPDFDAICILRRNYLTTRKLPHPDAYSRLKTINRN